MLKSELRLRNSIIYSNIVFLNNDLVAHKSATLHSSFVIKIQANFTYNRPTTLI